MSAYQWLYRVSGCTVCQAVPCQAVRCARLYGVPGCTVCQAVPCARLYRVSGCTVCQAVPCARLYRVPGCTVYPAIPCARLPCARLYHVPGCTVCQASLPGMPAMPVPRATGGSSSEGRVLSASFTPLYTKARTFYCVYLCRLSNVENQSYK